MSTLSVLLIINNEEKQLEDCLKSVSFANQLIIVLDKCIDNSERIAKRFTKEIYSGSWEIEGDRRNFGISKCTCDWILEVDADERVPNNLKKEILKTIKSSNDSWHLIPVNNVIGKRVITYGWGAYIGKSSYAGLFKNNTKIWGKQRVHPKVKLIGSKGKTLKNGINHFYCKSIEDLFKKLDSYATARAMDMLDEKNQESLIRNLRRIFSRFWKSYFLRKGYKENKIGLIIGIVAALYPLIAYLKLKLMLKND